MNRPFEKARLFHCTRLGRSRIYCRERSLPFATDQWLVRLASGAFLSGLGKGFAARA